MRISWLTVCILLGGTAGCGGEDQPPQLIIALSVSNIDRTDAKSPHTVRFPTIRSFALKTKDLDGSDFERIRIYFESAGLCQVSIRPAGEAIRDMRPSPWPKKFRSGDSFEIGLYWPYHKGELVSGAVEDAGDCEVAPKSSLERMRETQSANYNPPLQRSVHLLHVAT